MPFLEKCSIIGLLVSRVFLRCFLFIRLPTDLRKWLHHWEMSLFSCTVCLLSFCFNDWTDCSRVIAQPPTGKAEERSKDTWNGMWLLSSCFSYIFLLFFPVTSSTAYRKTMKLWTTLYIDAYTIHTPTGCHRRSTRHPLSERYRLIRSISTANDLFRLIGAYYLTVAIILVYHVTFNFDLWPSK